MNRDYVVYYSIYYSMYCSLYRLDIHNVSFFEYSNYAVVDRYKAALVEDIK